MFALTYLLYFATMSVFI